MSVPIPTDSRRANYAARAIQKAFEDYRTEFQRITNKAKARFENRDWHGMLADAVERLSLYKKVISQVVTEIHELLGDRIEEKLLWVSIKAVYSGRIADRHDWELAETFFNSVTRQIFTTVGVDPQVEFVDTDFETPPIESDTTEYHVYDKHTSTANLIETILADYPFDVEYEDFSRDVALAVKKIETYLKAINVEPSIDRVETVNVIFHRGRATYVVGRMTSGSYSGPFVLALHNHPEGRIIDAVLLSEDDVSILFSFAHSYFHVNADRPYDLVKFLQGFMPRKKDAELYISLGFNKHGKTELYRDLLHHLANADDKFEIAAGERGMVMVVFTMPSYEVVLKLIKDRFAEPKDSTRRQVMEKYRLVFRHDRAGRLVDAQEFEHLKFYRRNFSEELLAELLDVAAQTVEVGEEYVIIHHAYIERRLTPLNIYVEEADMTAAKAAVIDYGNAIKDLMITNIFPGDLLLKNFGVTRHGRVVFYDYDELCLLTECKFRKIPRSKSYEDELSAEPWFSVGENDVFPEQFPSFLGLKDELRQVFIDHHSDLFDAKLWRQTQKSIKAGDLLRIIPYGPDRQLH
jgi:isocitrate dehydrogenase kinase/phosphatase